MRKTCWACTGLLRYLIQAQHGYDKIGVTRQTVLQIRDLCNSDNKKITMSQWYGQSVRTATVVGLFSRRTIITRYFVAIRRQRSDNAPPRVCRGRKRMRRRDQ